MTHRLSSVTKQDRLCLEEPAEPACAYRSSARHTAAIKAQPAAFSGSSSKFAPVSDAMRTLSRTPDEAVVPTVCALSP